MIIDITGIELTPGNFGKNCLGNGEHYDEHGNILECCCDECSYMMCCLKDHDPNECMTCTDNNCPNSLKIQLDMWPFF